MKLNKRQSEGLWEVDLVEISFKVWLTLEQCGFKRAGPRAFIYLFSIKTVSPSYPGVSRADSQAGFNQLQSESYFCIPIDRFLKFCFHSTVCWICRCKKTTAESKVTRGASTARQLAPLTSTLFKSKLYRRWKFCTGFDLPLSQVNKLEVILSLFLWEVML